MGFLAMMGAFGQDGIGLTSLLPRQSFRVHNNLTGQVSTWHIGRFLKNVRPEPQELNPGPSAKRLHMETIASCYGGCKR